jgi:hypothetical protein
MFVDKFGPVCHQFCIDIGLKYDELCARVSIKFRPTCLSLLVQHAYGISNYTRLLQDFQFCVDNFKTFSQTLAEHSRPGLKMLLSAMFAIKIHQSHVFSIPLLNALKLTNKRFPFQDFAKGYTPSGPSWRKETIPPAPTVSMASPCARHFALAALLTQI